MAKTETKTKTETKDTGLPAFEVATEVPRIRSTTDQPSKYESAFEAARQSKTGAITMDFGDAGVANAKASYIRRVAPEGMQVKQRGGEVLVGTDAFFEAQAAEKS